MIQKKILAILLCIPFFFGCQPSYPKDYVEESIKEICFEEYGITDVEVKLKGKTLGVYLPLKQLFSVDYEKFLKGQVEGSLENLVSFHPEALEKVEDVLFSTSRVILSTDRKIDFYMLNAADTLVTGLQFTIIGNILDMKRVRFWDIPRSEYRKRLIHDIAINQSITWKRTVKKLFEEIPLITVQFSEAGQEIPSRKMLASVIKEFFVDPKILPENSLYFYQQLLDAQKKKGLQYDILDIRAKPLQGREILIYAKVQENFNQEKSEEQNSRFQNGFVGEYLFILRLMGLNFKILQVIPFHFIDESGTVADIEFPEDLKLYQNLDEWPEDFDFEEIFLEDFIAEQLTKRLHGIILEDPRIQQEFIGWKQEGKVSFVYEKVYTPRNEEDGGYFILNFFLGLRNKLLISVEDVLKNQHLLYFIDKILREFFWVTRSYSFSNYTHLDIQLPVADSVIMITKSDLIKFGKKRLSIEELLKKSLTFK